jgi:hypothetical protein
MFRTALASVQKSAQAPSENAQAKLSSQSDRKGSTHSRHNEFSEVTFCLMNKLESWVFIAKGVYGKK